VAIGIEPVAAQRPFEGGTHPFDIGPGSLVAFIGTELDALATPGLERVAKHQPFGLGVDSRALSTRVQPGVADLDRIGSWTRRGSSIEMSPELHRGEPGRAHDLGRGDIDGRER